MANYKRMYHRLLIEVNNTITRLEKVLDEAEDIYIETEEEADLQDGFPKVEETAL